LYWRDSGLLHALLQVRAGDDVFTKPWVGASWEGWVVEQILNHLQATGEAVAAYHVRTSDNYEADLLLEWRGRRWVVEVKLTSVPAPQDMARLEHVGQLVKADRCLLVSRTTDQIRGRSVASLNLPAVIEHLLG
jgi:predicted AAA+ superfamily ATPase